MTCFFISSGLTFLFWEISPGLFLIIINLKINLIFHVAFAGVGWDISAVPGGDHHLRHPRRIPDEELHWRNGGFTGKAIFFPGGGLKKNKTSKQESHQEYYGFLVENFIWTNRKGETILYLLPIGRNKIVHQENNKYS